MSILFKTVSIMTLPTYAPCW